MSGCGWTLSPPVHAQMLPTRLCARACAFQSDCSSANSTARRSAQLHGSSSSARKLAAADRPPPRRTATHTLGRACPPFFPGAAWLAACASQRRVCVSCAAGHDMPMSRQQCHVVGCSASRANSNSLRSHTREKQHGARELTCTRSAWRTLHGVAIRHAALIDTRSTPADRMQRARVRPHGSFSCGAANASALYRVALAREGQARHNMTQHYTAS